MTNAITHVQTDCVLSDLSREASPIPISMILEMASSIVVHGQAGLLSTFDSLAVEEDLSNSWDAELLLVSKVQMPVVG